MNYQDIWKKRFEEINIKLKNESSISLTTNFIQCYTTAVSTFKWENLPKTILPHMPENFLMYWDRLAFFKDDNGEFKMYPCYPCGELMENGEYKTYYIISKNGTQWIRNYDEISICYPNSIRIPMIVIVKELSEKMSYSLRAVNTTLKRIMVPQVASCTDETSLKTLSDMYDDEKNLLPFRATMSNSLKNGDITISEFFDNRKYDVLAQWDIYVRYRNLFYTMYGINNVEIQKRERLTEAEGSGNSEIARYTFLKDLYDCRMNFINDVKEKFGHELKISLNRDVNTVYEIITPNDKKLSDMDMLHLRGVNYDSVIENKNSEGNENEI